MNRIMVICLLPSMVPYNSLFPFKVCTFVPLVQHKDLWCVHVGLEVTVITLDCHILSLFL